MIQLYVTCLAFSQARQIQARCNLLLFSALLTYSHDETGFCAAAAVRSLLHSGTKIAIVRPEAADAARWRFIRCVRPPKHHALALPV